MIKGLIFLVKLTGFAIAVLVLANRIEFGGKTISDQVLMQMSHAEKSEAVKELKKISDKIVQDMKEGAIKKFRSTEEEAKSLKERATREARLMIQKKTADDEFTDSERSKLRELIRDLNHTAMN